MLGATIGSKNRTPAQTARVGRGNRAPATHAQRPHAGCASETSASSSRSKRGRATSERSVPSGRPQRRAVAHRFIEGGDKQAAIVVEEPFDVLAVDCRDVDHYQTGACRG